MAQTSDGGEQLADIMGRNWGNSTLIFDPALPQADAAHDDEEAHFRFFEFSFNALFPVR